MSKDKLYGWMIAIITTVLFLVYTYLTMIQWFFLDNWMADDGKLKNFAENPFLDPISWVIIPVWAAGLLTWFIIAWIGYTMATTPPPEPIDLDELDLEEDISAGEEATSSAEEG